MTPKPHDPGERQPPMPGPHETTPPVEEPEPEDMPDERRTPNPDEVREPPIHTDRRPLASRRPEMTSVARMGSQCELPRSVRAATRRDFETCPLCPPEQWLALASAPQDDRRLLPERRP